MSFEVYACQARRKMPARLVQAQEEQRCKYHDSKSINVQIVPDHNVTLVAFTNLLEQLFFASCFSALRCPRLITARVRTVVENQQSWLCFVGDLGELFRRCDMPSGISSIRMRPKRTKRPY